MYTHYDSCTLKFYEWKFLWYIKIQHVIKNLKNFIEICNKIQFKLLLKQNRIIFDRSGSLHSKFLVASWVIALGKRQKFFFTIKGAAAKAVFMCSLIIVCKNEIYVYLFWTTLLPVFLFSCFQDKIAHSIVHKLQGIS